MDGGLAKTRSGAVEGTSVVGRTRTSGYPESSVALLVAGDQ